LILDTDILIALLKGETAANEAVRGLQEKSDHVATTIITAYELLKGARLSSKSKDNLAEVPKLLSSIEVLDLTLRACEEASNVYLYSKKAGCLAGEFDVLIAAIARIYGETIMTRDQHFGSFQSVKVAGW
jgi:predicted nucleic acid-binding protein